NRKRVVARYFFFDAFLADFFAAFLAALGAADFLAGGAADSSDFLPNARSQLAQNLGFVPVRTIGPLMTFDPWKGDSEFHSAQRERGVDSESREQERQG